MFFLSLAIMVLQVSCKKDAIAQDQPYILPIATTERLGAVIVDGVTLKISEKGVLSTTGDVVILNPIEDNFIVYGVEGRNNNETIWIMNEDGGGKTRVDVAIPPSQAVNINAGLRVTRGGKILFITEGTNSDLETLYQCDKDGRNLKVLDQTSSGSLTL